MAGDRRAVLVTGASTGIGEATALRLARGGFRVFAGVRQPEAGEALAEKSQGAVEPLRLDVTDPELVEAAVAAVDAEVGERGLHGLVNNAGISLGSPVEFAVEREVRDTFEVNLFGLMATTRAALPLIRRARGRIVNMGSISGRAPVPFMGTYAASKAAVWAVTEAMRGELRPWGIEVALVEPGSIATPIWEKGLEAFDRRQAELPPEAGELYGRVIPKLRSLTQSTAKRGISPDEVAKRVEHALTARRPKTRYLVGTDARAQALLRSLPDRARDALIARFIGA